MFKRNLILLVIFTLLLLLLGIQALKQIEARRLLILLNQRNKAIIDAMPDLLLTMRADGTILIMKYRILSHWRCRQKN